MRDFRLLNLDLKRKIFLYMMPILLQKDVNLVDIENTPWHRLDVIQ